MKWMNTRWIWCMKTTEMNNKKNKPLKILIAGGGTGGHVFPAIAIASAIQKKVYDARILFIGAKGRMEMKKVPEAGFHVIGLDIAGLQRRLTTKNLLLPFKLMKSLRGARIIVKRFKPDLVIGVGGYASGPVLWAASRKKVPVLIQEQNSFPGLTNRILGKKADIICVAYEGMDQYFPKEKIYLTGNPVRENMVDIENKRDEALRYFKLKPGKPVLLVTGGSLGARTINMAVAKHLKEFIEKDIQLIWQTGESFHEKAIRLKNGLYAEKKLFVSKFIERMDYAYAAADAVVSRAGAIAVSELCIIKKPSILIPSPMVAEDHQTKNAQVLVNQHAAIMIKDDEAIEKLGNVVSELMFNKNKMHALKERIAGLAQRNAADRIASVALSMIVK